MNRMLHYSLSTRYLITNNFTLTNKKKKLKVNIPMYVSACNDL